MSYIVTFEGTFRVDPRLPAKVQGELSSANLGWQSTPNGRFLFWPTDADREGGLDALAIAVELISKAGCAVSGQASWHGEDETTGTAMVTDNEVSIETDPEEQLSSDALEELLTDVMNAPEQQRLEAMEALVYLGPRDATVVPAYVACLSHESHRIRMAGAEYLAALGSEAIDAVDDLIAALSDTEPWVQAAAAEALGSIGPGAEAAIPALQELERHPNYGPSGRAREAIGQIMGVS